MMKTVILAEKPSQAKAYAVLRSKIDCLQEKL